MAIASGTRLVFVAGQVARHTEPDLAAAGGSFDDVAKLNFSVVGWTPDQMPALLAGIARGSAKVGTTAKPPATLIGVAALDVPEHLVEIEATAVL